MGISAMYIGFEALCVGMYGGWMDVKREGWGA